MGIDIEQPQPVDEVQVRQDRIRELRKVQNGGVWTTEMREEILRLIAQDKPVQTTLEMTAALNRQSRAGFGNEPALTKEEQTLIIKANLIAQSKKRG